MKALIDADIFQWEFGSATDDEFKPLAWPFVVSRIRSRISEIVTKTNADSYQLYLTSDDKSNFRYKIATIKPYKGNRTSEKPFWYNQIRNFLVDQMKAIEVFGKEADDALAVAQTRDYLNTKAELYVNELILDELKDYYEQISQLCNTVICSRDKDLNMVPGWHYTWGVGKQKEKELWWQDELSGLKCFYKQCLTGDSVDNIPGCFGVGKSSTLLSRIDDCKSEYDMFNVVFKEYEKRFGSYSKQFYLENARLLWMVREDEKNLYEIPEGFEERYKTENRS